MVEAEKTKRKNMQKNCEKKILNININIVIL
jgi:hypothetical protein